MQSRACSLLLCSLLISVFSFAQPATVDSLKKVLATQEEDTGKVKTLNRLSWALRSSDPATALNYAEQARALAEKTNFDKGRGDSYNNIGVIHYRRGEYIDAIKAHLQALSIRERIGDKQGMVLSYINLGNVYSDQNNNELALTHYSNAADLINTLNDKSRLPTVYLNIGAIYMSQKNYAKGLEYCRHAKDEAEKNGDKEIEALALNNIGFVYETQENFTGAMDAYQLSYELCETLGNQTGMVDAAINIGSLYRTRKQYPHALEWHFKAEAMARESEYLEGIRVLYEEVSKDYAEMGQYEDALKYHIRFKEVSDSLFNDENSSRINELTNRWQGERRERVLMEKEQELARRTETEKRAQQRVVIIGIGAFLLLIFAGYVLYAWQRNRRANVLLAAQNQVIERKNEELGIKNKDITDSIIYSRRIQRAMLPSLTKMEQHLPDSFVLYRPRDIVSGDFYWVEPWGNEILIAAGDCTGHGVPGALLSVVGLNLLNQALQVYGISKPAPILHSLNKGMQQTLGQHETTSPAPGLFQVNDGMDIALLSIDRKNYRAEFAGANNPVWLLRNGVITEFRGNRQAIGQQAHAAASFDNHTIDLRPGDALYLFTDGYADQFGGPNGKKFKIAHLRQLLTFIGHRPMAEQKQLLEQELDQWRGQHEQVDDILLIGIRI